MKHIIIVWLFFAGFTNFNYAQTLMGVVVQHEHHDKAHADAGKDSAHEHVVPVPGVVVMWEGTDVTTITGNEGRFRIKSVGYPAKLILLAPGCAPDTLAFDAHPGNAIHYEIKDEEELDGFEVKAHAPKYSLVEPRNMQFITQSDIKKAACCNLSESFETNASVDMNYTDAVTGTKTIRMLGLDGIYTQILFENIPFVRGLESKYGLSMVPGTWAESIQITKGAGSVTNGFESMAGQINIEFQKPDVNEREQFYANVYVNHQLRSELNFHYRHRINKTWSALLLLHAMDMSTTPDRNKDGFMDSPMNRTYAGTLRLRYVTPVVEGFITAGGAYQRNMGGQTSFTGHDHDHTNMALFGSEIVSQQGHFMIKNGFLLPNTKAASLGIIGSGRYYDMEAMIGNYMYTGIQRSVHLNTIYENMLGNTLHKIRTGISYNLDDYRESLADSAYTRTESIPGVHAEYSYNDDFRWNIVAGVRADYHNLYGLWLTPRLHFKYTLTEFAALRLSAGKGYRRSNAIAENLSTLASSRIVKFTDDLHPEESWNAGISYSQEFRIKKQSGIVRLDYYYTTFVNQMVINLENPDFVKFGNLDGKSYSHAAQAEWTQDVTEGFTLTAAYRFTLTRSTFDGVEKYMPFVPLHRSLLNAGFETENEKWRFDITGNFFGASRLPDTWQNPEAYQLSYYSKPYFSLSAQITKVFRFFEVYLGGENLTNYIQPNAIIDPENPFGSFFDASLIWGPVNGAIVYAGLRTTIKTDRNVKINEL
jgi:outer membrane receptor for ferrienterochelin and colicins